MAQARDVYCVLAKKSSPKTVHIDLPRCTLDKDIDWTVIESIKNGQFQSNKYSSQRICWLEKPHVIIYANRHLDYTCLSLDRWRLYGINKRNELVNITDKYIQPLIAQGVDASDEEEDL